MHESIIAEAVRDPKFLARFWRKVDKSGECWTWMGAKSGSRGYGGIGAQTFGAKHFRAHRVAWTIENGKIPNGLLVLHRCDNPRCVRASHLFVGTDQDNATDKASKGRSFGLCGQDNKNAKLSSETVIALHAAMRFGESRKSAAARFGVTTQLASKIATGRAWKHLGLEKLHRPSLAWQAH